MVITVFAKGTLEGENFSELKLSCHANGQNRDSFGDVTVMNTGQDTFVQGSVSQSWCVLVTRSLHVSSST